LQTLIQLLGNLWLRLLAAPVRIDIVPVARLDAAAIAELHALANGLMREDLAQFTRHVGANDVVHVFRERRTGAVLGFQFWRHRLDPNERLQYIMGGKLRMHPSIRRRGLHLCSGLLYAVERRLRRPDAPIVRLSIAALFGFVSISEALAHYLPYPAPASDPQHAAINAAFAEMAEFSRFVIRDDGLFFVNIYPTAETLARYPVAYFERDAAREYQRLNPGFRDNGCYIGFWFRFDRRNALSLLRAVWKRRAAQG
jgi:hypothetical protein